jgi:hypothetical protein
MKTVYKVLFYSIVGCSLSLQARAQDDINELLKGNSDAKYLVDGYIAPFMQSLSASLNQGWYNTAKPHKIAGFDLTITANAMFIPASQNYYNVGNLDSIKLISNQPNGNVPTLLGPDEQPKYQATTNTGEKVEFSGPGGLDLKKQIGYNALPIPMVNLGFGLPKGFDIKLRFTPKIDIGDDGSVQLWGVGLMHDVKQYIPGLKLLPFDLSAFVGYTHLKLTYDMSGSVNGSTPTVDFGQQGIFEVNATTIQGVISKKMSVLTVYGGLGYNIAKSSLALKGEYDLDDDGTADVKDPYEGKFSASGARVTAGFRLKLAVFTLHADYTVQKYSCLTAGFGIAVR